MLVELGLVEQRYQAVVEVLGGVTVTGVAERFGVSRQSVHRWLRRYASRGLAGLVDGSTVPGSCPHQMAPEIEAMIVEWRRAHPTWGPRTIVNRLAREGVDPLPSRSGVYRALVRRQLIDPKRRRRRRSGLEISAVPWHPKSDPPLSPLLVGEPEVIVRDAELETTGRADLV